ncbi:MAG: FtsX-like permease family protein [Pseudomonadota bacterium]
MSASTGPVSYRLALRFALRELRGGIKGFRVLIACLALGVAAIAAVGNVRMAIETGLDRNAALLLGGDAEISFSYRFASEPERVWMESVADEISEIVDFRSMLGTGTEADGIDRTLVQVKAVDSAYPLYGTVTLADDIALEDALALGGESPGLVADTTLMDQLGLSVGDSVTLGDTDFRLAGRLLSEPDNITQGITLGPRVFVLRDALEGSVLLTEGSLFEASYRLRLPEAANLAALRAEARDDFGDRGLQWRDRRGGVPAAAGFVDRLADFLVLLGIAGLAVGGVGVAAAVKSHLDAKTETIAIFKTLGATARTIYAVYFIQIGLLSLLGIGLGIVFGTALPLIAAPIVEARLPVPAVFQIYPQPIAEAAIYGALTACIFTLWPLARARSVRAAELFRDASSEQHMPGRWDIGAVTALLLLLIAVATLFSGNSELTLYISGGILASLAVLWLAATGLRLAARRAAHASVANRRPAFRWAIAALGGPGSETVAVCLSLGLGLTVLASIGQIDSNLRGLVLRELPERAPAYFLLDIQNAQHDELVDRSLERDSVTDIDTAPMLRGIITQINGQNAREVAGPHWVFNGDRGITYATEPPPGTTFTAGEWWPEDYDGPPLVSFAEEEGTELGLSLGDEITLNVLGRDIVFQIASFREVEFETMGINFIMVVNPSALQGAPHTHIATVYMDDSSQEGPYLRELSEAYPNVTAVRTRDAIERAGELLEGIGVATRWGASVTLLTGIIVLIGAAAAGERRRIYEAAILKTLGATRARILGSFALRSAFVGAAAGGIAIVAGAIGGWWVTTQIMGGDFSFSWVSALGIVIGGALANLLAGLGFALRPLAARPAHVLRSRE